MGDAISFPDQEEFRKIYKKEKIWSKVKAELIKEGRLKLENYYDDKSCLERDINV